MASRVGRWGSSLSVRLPASLCAVAGIKAGDEVELRLLSSGCIRVRPLKGLVPEESESAADTPVAAHYEQKW
jgi:antitoxin component of MazEF toxin-antitoxin module